MFAHRNRIELHLLDYFLITALFIITFILEQHIYLVWDVGWHLEGARRMLSGGNYSTTLFDDNPPMVFWVYIPAVLMHRFTTFSLPTLTILTNHILILLSFLLCNIFLKLIYADAKRYEIQMMRYGILVALLIFPTCNFGMREIMLTVFCMPYITLIGARLVLHGSRGEDSRESLRAGFRQCFRAAQWQFIFIGIWAAIGVALNPLYGLVILTLEIQLWIAQRKLILHPETLTFFTACALYLIVIGLFYPSYYTVIIPSTLVFSPGYNDSFYSVNHNLVVYTLILASTLLYALRINRIKQSWTLSLWFCALITYLIYLSNMKIWFYHLYPALAFSFLLLVAIFLDAIKVTSKTDTRPISILSGIIIVSITASLLWTYQTFVRQIGPVNEYENHLAELIDFFNKQPKNSSLYVFSARLYPAFPLIDYTTLRYLPPWPDCWTLPIIVRQNKLAETGWKKAWVNKYKTILFTQVVRDFREQKPDYVVVDISPDKYYFRGTDFSFITYFSQDAAFRAQWKHYHFVRAIGDTAVYQRC